MSRETGQYLLASTKVFGRGTFKIPLFMLAEGLLGSVVDLCRNWRGGYGPGGYQMLLCIRGEVLKICDIFN